MSKTKFSLPKILHWLDDNILLLLGGFLLVFIPLWPKIPVFSPIEQYIVRVRLEDFFVLFTILVYFIQLLRKKVAWRSPLSWGILAYAVVGLLSTLSAIFITRQIPLQILHIEKSFLHYFRYLEYFSLFFILFAAIRRKKDVFVLLAIFVLTVVGVSIYGYGQKYYYWPVYSTMNREFSKGERLILTPHARVQSTFAGHYDMAAFLVIALPIILVLSYRTKSKLWFWFLFISYWMGTWLIIVSASRTSFVAFLAAIGLAVLISSLQREDWLHRIWFAISRGMVVLVFTGIIFLFFGQDLSERLSQIIGFKPPQIAPQVQAPPPKNAITTDQALQMGILNPTDELPENAKPPSPIPSPKPVPQPTVVPTPKDVYVTVPVPTQVSTTAANGQKQTITVNEPRTYSDNAIKYGLSMAIRLDTLWPNAIRGFLTNPILGKGYATLNKENVNEFTIAESTDNNFLRTIGETGILGFVTFYGCVVILMVYCVKTMRSPDPFKKGFATGLFCASAGLLLNAIYIDVYASSKVAETYWALAGIFFGFILLEKKRPELPTMIVQDLAVALKKTTKTTKKRKP